MKKNEFTNSIIVYNEDEEDHVETFQSDLKCDQYTCKKKGCYINENRTDSSRVNGQYIEDRPLCFECMKNCFSKITCAGCNEVIFNEDDRDEYTIRDCRCKTVKEVKVKALKEKPILECQWVRARNYQ